jgi:hypothetical protein
MSLMTRPAEGGEPSHPNKPRRPRLPSAPRPAIVAALAALAIALVFIAVSWTHAPWRDYVRRKPPAYVELTFVGPASLPATFRSGQPVRFSFVINNVGKSGTSKTVDWTTSVRDTETGQARQVSSGSAVIDAGNARTVSGQVTIEGSHRNEVIVKLGSGQQIDFYVTAAGTAGSG